jgi:hypothetical protein
VTACLLPYQLRLDGLGSHTANSTPMPRSFASARSRNQRDQLRTYLAVEPKPAGGYRVAIYGHGGGENKLSSGLVAAKLAEHGIATIAIDGPGFGFGPLSTYTVAFTDSSSVTFPSDGRSIDQTWRTG